MIFLLPELILCGLGLAATVAALWSSRRSASAFALGGFFTCLFGMGVSVWLMLLAQELGPEGVAAMLPSYVAHTFSVEPFSLFFSALALGICGLAMLFSMEYIEKVLEEHHCELLALIAFASLGIACVASARELITLFFSLELVSISGYLLAGMLQREERSLEAAIKYFLLGAISSAIMLYGMSLVYGATSTTDLGALRKLIALNPGAGGAPLASLGTAVSAADPIIITGVLAIVVGLGFKVAMVPFHTWCPDTYEGAPTPVTAFLSVGPKAAGFAAIIRVLMVALAPDADTAPWREAVLWMCVATMTLGNVVACRQTNIKRMLAYSSIAHSGYVLVAVVSLGSAEWAIPGILMYLVAYTLMNVGAFAVVIAFSNTTRRDDLEAYNGLFRRSPFLAVAWVIFAMSLIGLPPTLGLLGKLYVLIAAVETKLLWLALVALLNSVISAWYYLRVARHMFFLEPAVESPIPVGRGAGLALALSLAGTVLLFPAFGVLYSMLQDVSRMLGAW